MARRYARKPPAPPSPPVEIPEGLLAALKERQTGIDSRELLTELTRVWGGVGPLALSIKQEFDNSAKGGMTRQRILEMVQRLVINNTSHELTNMVRPGEMTDDQLQATLAKYIAKVQAAPEKES